MGTSRIDLFTDEQNKIALLAKVLGHPARIAIIQHLLQANQCINSDLVQELGLAQATISQHLRELKEAGFIQGNISGTSMNYCINAERWNEIRNLFLEFFDQYPLDKCC